MVRRTIISSWIQPLTPRNRFLLLYSIGIVGFFEWIILYTHVRQNILIVEYIEVRWNWRELLVWFHFVSFKEENRVVYTYSCSGLGTYIHIAMETHRMIYQNKSDGRSSWIFFLKSEFLTNLDLIDDFTFSLQSSSHTLLLTSLWWWHCFLSIHSSRWSSPANKQHLRATPTWQQC